MNVQVNPIRRNLKFALPTDKALDWNKDGLHVSQFFNTLSIFFPAGERFFIQSVRNYRDEITGEQLKEQISAFIGQEGFHTREHEAYNEALKASGMPIEQLDQVVVFILDIAKRFPRAYQLAITVSLEHLTAVMGDMLLENKFLLDGAEEHYAAIWSWHAIEETEHKAVCFDAYEQVVGTGPAAYAMRTSSFIIANLVFWSVVLPFYVTMLSRSGGVASPKGWFKVTNLLLGTTGIMRRKIPDWLDYFRPSFHPWMHDNREYLNQAQALMEQVASFQPIKPVKAVASKTSKKTRSAAA